MLGGSRYALAAVTLGAVALGALWPVAAPATTVRLGPPIVTSTTELLCNPCSGGLTVAQLADLGVVDEAPSAGVITGWRVNGAGVKLRVLREAAGGQWLGAGTSASAAHGDGEENATSLPIQAGDIIGVDIAELGDLRYTEILPKDNTTILRWAPALGDGALRESTIQSFDNELLVNADIVLTPVLTSVSPPSGSVTGGTAVKLAGQFLDSATSVTFGSTPAPSFSIDSSSQITAIAPASGASTVDVRVSGPGGSSGVTPADRYTFTAPASSGSPSPGAGAPSSPAKPTVTGFTQSARRWKRGGALPRISSTSIGTTFSFTLNEPAAASLAFTRRAPGRRVKGNCVAVTNANTGKPRCTLTVRAGSLTLPAHAGQNALRFQGNLSRAKRLKPGNYGVGITASDARGLRSPRQSLTFTIVAG